MIDEHDIARLKEIFVTKDHCSADKKSRDEKIEALRVDTAKAITKLNIVIAILSAIGTSMVGVAIKVLFP